MATHPFRGGKLLDACPRLENYRIIPVHIDDPITVKRINHLGGHVPPPIFSSFYKYIIIKITEKTKLKPVIRSEVKL
jgi:hypothetical protein